MADFLADHPASGSSKLYDNLSDEVAEVFTTHAPSEEQIWQLFFDGASRTGSRGNIIARVGVVLVIPHNYVMPRAFSLTEPCSNNVAEYTALLIKMQLADEIRVKNLEAYGDLKLIINQVQGEHKVQHEDLIPYHRVTINMAEKFKSFYINHVPQQQNARSDALASLASSLDLPAETAEEVLVHSHNLYCLKFALEENMPPKEDLQVKKVLEISTGPEFKD